MEILHEKNHIRYLIRKSVDCGVVEDGTRLWSEIHLRGDRTVEIQEATNFNEITGYQVEWSEVALRIGI